MLGSQTLNGSIHATFVRCGKANCRCARGERHGPYYHRYQRVGDRILKEYIPLALVTDVRAACTRYQQQQSEIRSESKKFNSMLLSLKMKSKELDS